VLILKDLGVNKIVKPGAWQTQVSAGLSAIQGLKTKKRQQGCRGQNAIMPNQRVIQNDRFVQEKNG
jgi:hypothetical protein